MPTSKEDLPSTIARSPAKVRRTFAKTLDSAHETYDGDEARAHRTARGPGAAASVPQAQLELEAAASRR